MHMADALLSPAVGGAMWVVSAATITYSSRKVRSHRDDRIIPLMGVMGAFIFCAQMINFTIPVTGSSGHLGGGVILAVLLGPYAAFLTIASVLVVQALFFADGGLLALGCNMFNLGFIPSFIAYPLIYKKIIGNIPTPTKRSAASMVAAVIGLQLGAAGVVIETVSSGISSLPFAPFLTIMQPIHLAIGIVEGLVTASVISFVSTTKPEIMLSVPETRPIGAHPIRKVILGFLAITLLTGGVLSWVASEHPDGLEWSITKVAGQKELKGPEQGLHGVVAALQRKLSFLPNYSFRKPSDAKSNEKIAPPTFNQTQKPEEKEYEVNRIGATVSGIVGGALTLGLLFIIGYILRRRNQPT